MTVIDVRRDLDALTLTVEARFDAPVERVWQVWADPRKLERWWGPPGYPATVTEHDLVPGGGVAYHMTGPQGDRHHGWWKVVAVDAPTRLEVQDGFADEHGTPSDTLPTTRMTVTLSAADGGTRVLIESRFASREALEQLVAMGMEEGIRLSVGQIDAILAEG